MHKEMKMNVSPTSAFKDGVAIRRRLPSPSSTVDRSSLLFPALTSQKIDDESKDLEKIDEKCHWKPLDVKQRPDRFEDKHAVMVQRESNIGDENNVGKDNDDENDLSRDNEDENDVSKQQEGQLVKSSPLPNFLRSSFGSMKGSHQGIPGEKTTCEIDQLKGDVAEKEEVDTEDKESATEDEEVKRNCFGKHARRNYIDEGSASDEDSADGDESGEDPESDGDEQPGESSDKQDARSNDELLTFVSGKTAASVFGLNVHRPTPVAYGQSDLGGVSGMVDDGSENDDDLSDDESSTGSNTSEEGGRGIGLTFDENEYESDDDSDAVSSSDSESEFSDEREEDSDSSNESEFMEEDDSEVDDDNDADEESAADPNGGDLQDDSNLDVTTDFANVKPSSSSIELELTPALGDNEGGDGIRAIDHDDKTSDPETTEQNGGCGVERRDSISMDELEEIINNSSNDSDGNDSDLELLRASSGNVEDGHPSGSSDEDIAGLLSDLLEFDFWSNDTVSAAVRTLITASNENTKSHSGLELPVDLPSSADTSFWIDKMLVAIAPQSRTLQHLVDHPDDRQIASKIISSTFRSELASLDLSEVVLPQNDAQTSPENDASAFKMPATTMATNRRLFVGSFAAAESRLALAALHIKHIVLISFHPLDELWVGDGVKYSTHILPSFGDGRASPVCEAISSGANEVATALMNDGDAGGGTSVLVACATGDEYSCAVGALILSRNLGIDKSDAIKRMTQLRPTAKIEPHWLEENRKDTESALRPAQKTKRVLSSQKLSDLGGKHSSTYDSLKRVCFSRVGGAENSDTLPPLPLFNLGEAADGSCASAQFLSMRQQETGADACDEIGTMLSLRATTLRGNPESNESDSSPVPLLTPPASPLTVQNEEGTATMCEWPSNLAVDSAITAAIALRPLSPNSLPQEEFDERIHSHGKEKQGKRKISISSSTGLTPKLGGIRVSYHPP